MRTALVIAAMCLGLASGGPAWADAVEDLGPPGEAKPAAIAAAVDLLGAPAYADREAAQRWLWEVADPGLEALRAAAGSDDAEVAMRARNLVEMIELGVPAGADQDVVQQARRLRDGSKPEQIASVVHLSGMGEAGRSVLRKLAPQIEDKEVRQRAMDALFRNADDEARGLIIDGEFEAALAMLAEAAIAGAEPVFGDYAALSLQLGKLEAAIERVEGSDLVAGPRALLLARLHRASGAPAKAAALLEGSESDFWRRSLLIEAGDWAGLHAHMQRLYPQPEKLKPIHEARRRMAMAARLATGTLADDALPAKGELSGGDRGRWAEFLMLNGRPGDALALYDDQTVQAVDLVMQLGTLEEQAKLAERVLEAEAAADDAAGSFGIGVLRDVAFWLTHVGRTEEATKLLTGRMTDEPTELNQHLAAALIRTGASAAAEGKLAGVINWESDDPLARNLASAMFGGAAARAQLWANVLGEQNFTNAERLALLRALVAGPADAATVANATQWFEQWWEARQPRRLDQGLAVAETLAQHRGDAAAVKWMMARLEKLPDGRWSRMELGRWLARRGQWEPVVEVISPIVESEPTQVGARWLLGHALKQTGKTEAGERHQRIAALLPLGSAGSRSDLMRAMAQVGVDDQALAAQRALLLATGEPEEYSVEVANMEAADAARGRGDHAEALRRQERTRLWLVRDSVGAMWAGMAEIDRSVRVSRARVELDAGRVETAIDIGRSLVDDYPHNIDAIIDVVHGLERAGQGEAADALFDRAFARLRAGCERFPNSPALANEAAWLAARCRRSLDEGRALAERAVEIDPKLDPAIDTLAELHFQQGRRDEAIRWIDKAIALNPDLRYYQQQKQRFKTGDPSTAPPE